MGIGITSLEIITGQLMNKIVRRQKIQVALAKHAPNFLELEAELEMLELEIKDLEEKRINISKRR